MIGYLRGRITARRPPYLTMEVHDIGYELEAPLSTFAALPSGTGEVTLFTHLLMREDTQQLFGFSSEAERHLFRSLLRASGVGAKLALAILSGLSVDEFARAVSTRDIATLKRLPGVGQKTAERLVVEMADRVGRPGGAGDGGVLGEAAAALAALGYTPREVGTMLGSARTDDGRTSEAIVREALRRSLGAKA